MSITRPALIAMALACGTMQAFAQPAIVRKFDSWGVYSYRQDGKSACYVLTVPQSMQPESVDHGNNYFIVSRASGNSGGFVPQAQFGYDLEEGSQVIATVGNKTFKMTTKGKNAWTLKEGREGELVSAMRGGASLIVEATSARGTGTRYVFSLAGVTAALKRTATCE